MPAFARTVTRKHVHGNGRRASATAHVGASTVNRKLAAVSAFYAHQARNGAAVSDLLAVWKTGGRGGWKPFLHHVSKGSRIAGGPSR
jgi:hypothetical protein